MSDKKVSKINVHFKWTKIPNYELIKYQLSAYLLKTTRPGFHQHTLEFRRYTDESLCFITYIKQHLLKRKELRHSDGGSL